MPEYRGVPAYFAGILCTQLNGGDYTFQVSTFPSVQNNRLIVFVHTCTEKHRKACFSYIYMPGMANARNCIGVWYITGIFEYAVHYTFQFFDGHYISRFSLCHHLHLVPVHWFGASCKVKYALEDCSPLTTSNVTFQLKVTSLKFPCISFLW